MLHVCKLAASIILHGLIAKVQGWGDRNNKIQLQKTTITIIINICTPLHFLKTLVAAQKLSPQSDFRQERHVVVRRTNFCLFFDDQSCQKVSKLSKSDKPEMVKRTCCTCVRVPLQLSNKVTWVSNLSQIGPWVKSESYKAQIWLKPGSSYFTSQTYWIQGRSLKFN